MNSVKGREFLRFATAASAAFGMAQAQEIPLRKPKAVVKLFKSPEGHSNGLENTNDGL